jgi:serine/threonine-protein kinase RIO1
LDGHKLSAGVANTLKVSSAKAAAARVRAGDKSDRATVEQALDPRTRMVSSAIELCMTFTAFVLVVLLVHVCVQR